MHFRQGSNRRVLQRRQSRKTQRINIKPNINDTDVRLYKLDGNGQVEKLWTKVDAIQGNNAIKQWISKNIRDFYVVQTRKDDEITFVFADRDFCTWPNGLFRTFIDKVQTDPRISEELTDIDLSIDYVSKSW